MISTLTPVAALGTTGLPARTAAPRALVVAVDRAVAQETTVLRRGATVLRQDGTARRAAAAQHAAIADRSARAAAVPAARVHVALPGPPSRGPLV